MDTTELPAPPFGERVRPHLPAMHAAARSVLRSHDLAWDAVQVALLRLWRRGVPPVDSALRHAAYLAALAVRRGILRRWRHELRAAAAREAVRARGDETELPGEQPEWLAVLLRALPAECRQVLELRAIHELPYEVIAENLDIPVGTVRSRLSRARRILKEKVAA